MKYSKLFSSPNHGLSLVLAGQRFIKKEVKVYLYDKNTEKQPRTEQAPNLEEYREWIAWNQRTK